MKALRSLALTFWAAFTPAGRAVSAFGAATIIPALVLGWTELLAVTATCSALLLLAFVAVWTPAGLTGSVMLQPAKGVVGAEARVDVLVEAGRMPSAYPVVTLPIADDEARVRLPYLRRRNRHRERILVATPRRGVHPVGPLAYVKADVLGLCSRSVLLAAKVDMYVRPTVTRLEPVVPGAVNDLEGAASDQPAISDLAFHSLREYLPGDDLRHVHWRSSAKADSLLVRQYLESWRSQVTVVLDQSGDAYQDEEEFELAVAVAASVMTRACMDDFDVLFAWGETLMFSRSADVLLDESCRVLTGEASLVDTGRRAAAAETRNSLVIVVTGSRSDGATALRAAAFFPADSRRILVQTDPTASVRRPSAMGIEVLTVSSLDHLRARLRMAPW